MVNNKFKTEEHFPNHLYWQTRQFSYNTFCSCILCCSTLTGNPDVQTESTGQDKHFSIPSGECCPGGHIERVPLAGSQEKPAGHSLQSTLSSELIRPGKQGCKDQKKVQTLKQYHLPHSVKHRWKHLFSQIFLDTRVLMVAAMLFFFFFNSAKVKMFVLKVRLNMTEHDWTFKKQSKIEHFLPYSH